MYSMIQKNPTLGRDFFFKASSGDFFNYAAQATDEDCLWVKRHDAGEGLGLENTRQVVRGGWVWNGPNLFVLIDIHDTNELN